MARDLRYMETGICAMCGKDVRLDEKEGRVVCEGCDMATDSCRCMSDDLDTRHESSSREGAMRKGTSASWKADPEEGYASDPSAPPDDEA